MPNESAITVKNAVIEALASVMDAQADADVLSARLVDELDVSDEGVVTITLVFADERPKNERWEIEDAVADAVEAVDGVTDVDVLANTRTGDANVAPGAPASDHGHSHSHGHGHQAPPGGPGAAPGGGGVQRLNGVGKAIAVASGKGGVGKSTVAVNLALALKHNGFRVGLLDVDVYGPSLPTLLGIEGRPSVRERKIVPLEAEGLKIMSLGFLMEDDTPVIWRGPIVSGIIRQFLQDVDWRGVDYLIIDLPPGTGDAQLSLAQSVPLDGAVVVTTPSDLALIDAARGLQMFRTLKVEVLGIVENMSHFVWPGAQALRDALEVADDKTKKKLNKVLEQHEKTYIFGQGGGAREAKRLGTAFLGEIPLDPEVRRGGDEGRPVMAADPDSPVAQAFVDLASRIAELEPVDEDGEPKKKKRGLFSFLRG